MTKSQKLYLKAKTLIPGGTQLLSKRPEMFLPNFWPNYFEKSKGCEVWDIDGKHYIDMSTMSVGACILGYADNDVNNDVKAVIDKGTMSTLNAPEEVELAELLLNLHPWADNVRYAKTGGEAMAIAVRIARAKTQRDVVLFCGYHGWHDWYLAANLNNNKSLDEHLLPGLNPLGVPKKLKGTAFPFIFNDVESFLELINKHRSDIGVIVLECVRDKAPTLNFLKTIKEVAKELNIVLIIDEISSGFRLNVGGAHLLYNIEPDIAVFAKGMSNGYPMAAIIGNKNTMNIAQDTFISSTYWTDRIGLVASIATINKMIECDVQDHLYYINQKIKSGWKYLASKHGIDIEVSGILPISHFEFIHNKPLILKTLFTQLMLDRGYLASTSCYVSYAHKKEIVEKYLIAVDESFEIISKAIEEGNPKKYLLSSPCQAGFKRLT